MGAVVGEVGGCDEDLGVGEGGAGEVGVLWGVAGWWEGGFCDGGVWVCEIEVGEVHLECLCWESTERYCLLEFGVWLQSATGQV